MKRVALACALVACAPAGREAPNNIVVGAVGDAGSAGAAPADGTRRARELGEPAPVELAMSEVMACVRTQGRVHCTSDMHPGLPIAAEPPLPGIEDAISVSLAPTYGCVATRAGKVFCFGDNTYGQLGAGLRAERSDVPVPVTGVTTAVRVATGPAHACALLRSGSVQCWGQNDHGQTGGSTSYHPAARELVAADAVPTITGAVAVVPGFESTFALTPARSTWCFGSIPNEAPGLGPAANVANGPPRLVPFLAGFDEIASSPGRYSCGIKNEEVFCWGDTYAVMPGATRARRSGWLEATGVRGARHVRVGSIHACALLADGSVTCWGSSYYGVLGRSAQPPDSSVREPALVAGLAPAVDLVVGGTTSCAFGSQSRAVAQCWGRLAHDPAPSGGKISGQETSDPVTIRLTE